MVEFGEQLRRAREAKGMTQQTLAEQLYVTRQAVSRWECGDRFPDLITTKEISRILEVSLDDLLSNNDMNKAVERNPVIEKPAINSIMVVLYSCIVFSYVVTIADIFIRFPFGSEQIDYSDIYLIIIQLTSLAVQVAVFVYAFITALKGMLSPKRTGIVIIVFFVSVIFTDSYSIFSVNNADIKQRIIHFAIMFLIHMIPGVIGALSACMVFVKAKTEKKWQYLIVVCSGIHVARIIMNCSLLIMRYRKSFTMNHVLNLMLNICIYLLIIYQTFVLNKKRESIKKSDSENF